MTAPNRLREPLDRPRRLRLSIRSESVPDGAPEVAHGVTARIEGGFFVVEPPTELVRTVSLWAGLPPGAVMIGCVPHEPGAYVEVYGRHETMSAADDAAQAERMRLDRDGLDAVLTCPDGEGAGLVVDLRWEDDQP